jgi:PHD/YefM family antitoxin component YafN of YafNO toxin-antitoxin module
MITPISVSKLRENLSQVIGEIEVTTALAILRHGETKAYLVAPELFASFIQLVEYLQDDQEGEDGIREFQRGMVFEDSEAVFRDLNL